MNSLRAVGNSGARIARGFPDISGGEAAKLRR
jgi:hypothetical protein